MIPVVEFYGIRHPIARETWRATGPASESMIGLVALVSIRSGRQIESDQCESRLPVAGILKSDDVLVALGASLELQASVAAKVLVIDLHVAVISAIVAVQSFRRGDGRADWGISLAGDYVSVTAEGLLVERRYLVLGVRRGIVHGPNAECPLTKTHIHVSRLVVFIVSGNFSARVDGQPKIGRGYLVGIDVDTAEGCVDLNILLFSVSILVDVDPAASNSGNQHCCQHNRDSLSIHSIRPHFL